MKVSLRVFGLTIAEVEFDLPVPPEVEESDDEDTDEGGRLAAADLSFGFAPDPVFRPLEWDEDEEHADEDV